MLGNVKIGLSLGGGGVMSVKVLTNRNARVCAVLTFQQIRPRSYPQQKHTTALVSLSFDFEEKPELHP